MNNYMRQAMIYLEHIEEKDDKKRLYNFGIPFGSPYEEIYSVLDKFKIELQRLEKEANEREEKEKKEKEVVEENVEKVAVEVV